MNGAASRLEQWLADEPATLAFAGRLALTLEPGTFVTLSGDLGAGKTTFARGVLRGLGYAGKVKSPTYTLVEQYPVEVDRNSRIDLYHFDFYRFKNPQEWLDAGFQEMLDGRSICLAEWPEKVGGLLPRADLEITLESRDGGRHLRFVANTERGQRCIERLNA